MTYRVRIKRGARKTLLALPAEIAFASGGPSTRLLRIRARADIARAPLHRYGRPEIFNTDQGAQFTGKAFAGVFKAAGVRISRNSKARDLRRSPTAR